MKTIAGLVLVAALLALQGCGSPALTCQTQVCDTGNGKTYQLCVNVDSSETWKFGGMSCAAGEMNAGAIESCNTQVADYCAGGGTGGVGGTGGTQGTGGAGGGVPCTYTVSGAQTATGTCTAEAAMSPSSGGVAVVVTAGSAFDFAATLSAFTVLTDGTYGNADAAPGFGGEYLVGTTGAYVLCSDSDNCNDAQGNTLPPQGSFDLVITDPGPSTSAGGGTLWSAPQGTLTVTMPAQVGGAESGTVTVAVTL